MCRSATAKVRPPREQGRYAQGFYTIVKSAYTSDNGPYVPKTRASE